MSQGYYARSETPTAGAVLAAARDELQLSILDVARHLKLSPAQVEALEEGAYDRLPGRVFVRGFLRNYAKLLGLDPQPLLRSIEYEMPQPAVVEEPPPAPKVVMPHGEPSRWPLYAGVAAVMIVAALAVYEFGFNDAQHAATTAGPPVTPSSVGAAPPGAQTPSPSAEATSAAASKPVDVTSAPGATGTSGMPPSRAQGELVSAPDADTQPAKVARPGERELHFRFDIESWVEVRDHNDKVIFSKLNRAGTEERINGMPPLKIVVGNARGVRLTYVDKPVDLTPHIGVTVARITLQ